MSDSYPEQQYSRERRNNATDDSLLSVVKRQQRLVTDLDALVKLLRRPQEEWLSVQEIARAKWMNRETGDITIRLGDIPTIRADHEWVGLLFSSLFDNALSHGYPTVIEIGYEDDSFYVMDDGRGIPISDRDRVLESGYSSQKAGSGYGLTVVEHVARAHDWGLKLREGIDGGTRFDFSHVMIQES